MLRGGVEYDRGVKGSFGILVKFGVKKFVDSVINNHVGAY